MKRIPNISAHFFPGGNIFGGFEVGHVERCLLSQSNEGSHNCKEINDGFHGSRFTQCKVLSLNFYFGIFVPGEIFRVMNGNGTSRSAIRIGMRVRIVLKKDQRSGALTEGVVKDILTSSPTHPHGIKVRLADGQVGRVREIPE
jgi:uncharacterized repeat protein (TIGR03833 family)